MERALDQEGILALRQHIIAESKRESEQKKNAIQSTSKQSGKKTGAAKPKKKANKRRDSQETSHFALNFEWRNKTIPQIAERKKRTRKLRRLPS